MGIWEEVASKSTGLNFHAVNNRRLPHLSLLLYHGLGVLQQYLWMKMRDEGGGKTIDLLTFFSEHSFPLGKCFLVTKSIKSSDSRCFLSGSPPHSALSESLVCKGWSRGLDLPWDTALMEHQQTSSDTSGVPYLMCKGLLSGNLEASAGVQYDQA